MLVCCFLKNVFVKDSWSIPAALSPAGSRQTSAIAGRLDPGFSSPLWFSS